jgi:CubicO group peptidase (beta-lactamase class C family)
MNRLSAVLLATAACSCAAPGPRAPARPEAAAYPHAAEPIGTVRQIYDGVLSPEMAVNTFRNIDRLFPTHTIPRSANPLPLPPAASALRDVRFTAGGKQFDLETFLDANRVAAILVLDNGRIALERYRYGNTDQTRWMSMSVAKSVTSTLIGAAVKQGRIRSITDPVTRYVPALSGSAYDGVSVRDVLMMASGVRWNETYTDPKSDRRRLLEAQIAQAPGGVLAVLKSLPRAAEPGTVNNYNTGETQVAAEILRGAVGTSLSAYLSDRIWSKVGMEADAKWWLDSPNGTEIGGSGISATLRDYGRFGLFLLKDGIANGDSILPAGWIHDATTPKVLRGGSTVDYGYLWWTPTAAESRRDSAFMAEGIHGQILYVNPAAKVIVVLWGARPHPTAGAAVDEWVFCDAVVRSLREQRSRR